MTVWVYLYFYMYEFQNTEEISLKPCSNGKCLGPNEMNHCLVTKHDNVGAVSSQTVLKTFKRAQCFAIFEQLFYVVQT